MYKKRQEKLQVMIGFKAVCQTQTDHWVEANKLLGIQLMSDHEQVLNLTSMINGLYVQRQLNGMD